MTRKLIVAAAQTGSVDMDRRREIIDAGLAMLDEAAKQGVGLLTFSELFLAPFFPNRLEEQFDRYFLRLDDAIVREYIARAAKGNVAMILPVAEKAHEGYFNAALVVSAKGEILGCYRKTHIPAYFPTEGPGGTGSFEKLYFTPGATLDTYEVAGARIGIQICNDRLYPEASKVLALKGAEMIVMPICYSTYADPGHRASIWEVPLRARAYENGVWVLAANRVGVEGPRHHLGRSMIVDPRGTILAEAGTKEPELLVREIDLDEVERARKKFPWWRDRRPDLYGKLT